VGAVEGPELLSWVVVNVVDCQYGLCVQNVQSSCPEKKMSEKKQNLQDTFLNQLRKSRTSVTIFLVNGVKLQGIVTWFDNFCVLLRRDGHSQLVYKHAISTIMPSQPVQLFEPNAETDAGRTDDAS